jgi:hypothetical protein
MNTQDKIVSFVNYINDPLWKPERIRGYRLAFREMSIFRRCLPVNVLEEIERKDGFFRDSNLEIAGVQSQAAISITDTMPAYSLIKKIEKIPSHFKIRSGSPHMVYRASDVSDILRLDKPKMHATESLVFYRNGEWIPGRFTDPSRVVDASAAGAALALAGVAMTYRYDATMEIESGNGTSVALPMNLVQIREVLKDRDKPESGDRRPALLHIVKAHKRCVEDEQRQVHEYLRGKIECHWRGWDITLRQSVYDAQRVQK